MGNNPRIRRFAGVLAAAALLLAACGDDDGDSSDATDAADEAAATEPAESEDTADDAASEDTAAEDTAADDAESEDTTADTESEPVESEPAEGDGESAGEMIIQPGECGLNNGEEATGDPIRLGAGATNVPGIDFTWGPKMSQLYFDCVNANGGIYGHPIEYSYEDGAPDPAVWTAIATKLVEEDQVLGVVGTFSVVECDVNGDYYADNGYHPIIAGVAPGCFLSDQWSAVNMGPYYSMLGGAQAALNAGATGKLVAASPNQPGMDYNNTAVESIADVEGLEYEGVLEDVPIADPAGFAQRLVQMAGSGGGVILDFTGPTVLPLLEAISQQGLVDEVVWASSTPPNDPSVAQALADCCGSDWDGKLLINAEFDLLDSGKPDAELMLQLHEDGNADFPVSAFAQMGFLNAKVATEALLRMGEGAEYTVESVNDAFYSLTNMESDMWCRPWYYSSGPDLANVSNNTDRTVVPQGGVMVETEECFDILATPANPLAEIREFEVSQGWR